MSAHVDSSETARIADPMGRTAAWPTASTGGFPAVGAPVVRPRHAVEEEVLDPAGASTPPRPQRAANLGHRFHLLDGLRFVAASAVVAYHFTAYPTPHWGRPVSTVFPHLNVVTGYGALGVQLFFVISGFVILLSAWGRSIPSFVASRVARIYPAYWAAVVLVVLLLAVIWPSGGRVSLEQALVNLTLLQTGFHVPDLDGVYWTLWAELCFYVMIAIFMRFGITTGRVLVACTLWPLASAFALGNDNVMLDAFLMPRWASLFAGGMLLYLIYREGHNLIAWLLVGMNAILAGRATFRGTFQSIQTNIHRDLPDVSSWLVVFGIFAVVALFTLTRLRDVSWRWLTPLGALTFPLYLVHEYWGLWIISKLYPAVPGRVAVGAAVLFSVALAWLIHRLIERPLGPRFRRRLQASLERVGQPAATRR